MAARMSKDEKLFAGILGALAVGAGVTGLYYLVAGVGREKNAALIPDAIEDRVDAVVESLNGKYGKDWVQLGLDTLQAGLRSILPKPLVKLVDAVYAAEQHGRLNGLGGWQKRAHAVAQAA